MPIHRPSSLAWHALRINHYKNEYEHPERREIAIFNRGKNVEEALATKCSGGLLLFHQPKYCVA